MTETEMLRKQVAELMDRVRELEARPNQVKFAPGFLPVAPPPSPQRGTGDPWYPPHEVTCGPNLHPALRDPLRIC